MKEAVPEAEFVFSDNDSGYSSEDDPLRARRKFMRVRGMRRGRYEEK
jgi:hypothetical protein